MFCVVVAVVEFPNENDGAGVAAVVPVPVPVPAVFAVLDVPKLNLGAELLVAVAGAGVDEGAPKLKGLAAVCIYIVNTL